MSVLGGVRAASPGEGAMHRDCQPRAPGTVERPVRAARKGKGAELKQGPCDPTSIGPLIFLSLSFFFFCFFNSSDHFWLLLATAAGCLLPSHSFTVLEGRCFPNRPFVAAAKCKPRGHFCPTSQAWVQHLTQLAAYTSHVHSHITPRCIAQSPNIRRCLELSRDALQWEGCTSEN